jgi:deazaflavin-dependent oxidoreductase (nitroreductase family)
VNADRKRMMTRVLWRWLLNPMARPFAGIAPWWVSLETTGRRSGKPRRTPLAAGPRDEAGMWVIAVQGLRSDFVRNIEASPVVRVRHRGHWHAGTASIHAMDSEIVRRFNSYARTGPKLVGIEPRLIRLKLRRQAADERI